MKIKGRLVFRSKGKLVNIIAQSLAPDNVEMETTVEKNSVIITFRADRIGTILASVDDYLMNATIVEKLMNQLFKPQQHL